MFRRKPRYAATDAQIAETVNANVALARRFDEPTRRRHTELTAELVATKHWEAVNRFPLTTEMVVTVAANAAVPILELDVRLYRQVAAIVLHPSATTTHGPRQGASASTVTEHPLPIIGQAGANAGPVLISWDTALEHSRNPEAGQNVVIHEFAHKIDMSDGYVDGIPPVRGDELERWQRLISDEYEDHRGREPDPILRTYAFTNEAEFFAVATETFFCRPVELRAAKPRLYAALAGFYHRSE